MFFWGFFFCFCFVLFFVVFLCFIVSLSFFLLKFGTDEKKDHSIYAKDYTLSSMVGRFPPKFHATPNAGKVI